MDPEPFKQFAAWLKEAEATNMANPNAMALATVGESGPSVRMVLLKSFDEKGFVFYTNYESKKAADIGVDPRVAVMFYWRELDKQVRIEGSVEKISREDSEQYFHSRPRESQLGAWASQQSNVIESRGELEKRFAELDTKFANGPIPLPPTWGGYLLVPQTIEFWSGKIGRLHDRILYTREGAAWRTSRISP